MLLKILARLVILAVGTIEYLRITAKERKVRREKIRRIKRKRAQKAEFMRFLDEATAYFDAITPRDNTRQKVICSHPDWLQAGEDAYREKARREKNA